MSVMKLIGAGAFTFGVSLYAGAEDLASLFSPGGRIVGTILADSGHVYDREHTLPGDPGFAENVYEIRATSARIAERHVVTPWLFCLFAATVRPARRAQGTRTASAAPPAA